jgi:hypothetical protein
VCFSYIFVANVWQTSRELFYSRIIPGFHIISFPYVNTALSKQTDKTTACIKLVLFFSPKRGGEGTDVH